MERTNGISCVVPRWIKRAIMVAGLVFWYGVIWQFLPGNWIATLLWAYIFVRIPFYSPDITVYDEGIAVDRFGFKNFLYWRDIHAIHVGTLNSRIHPKGINRWVAWLLYDLLLINRWRTNYHEAMNKASEQFEAAQQAQTQRAY